MEFLGDSNNSTAVDVISFVREVVECNSKLRKHILEKLLMGFGELKAGKVLRGALWILGEYCTDLESMCLFILINFITLRT
jgi:coatomer subunit beta